MVVADVAGLLTLYDIENGMVLHTWEAGEDKDAIALDWVDIDSALSQDSVRHPSVAGMFASDTNCAAI